MFVNLDSNYANLLSAAQKGIEGLLNSFEAINKEILTLDEDLKEICKQDKEVLLLMTAPGVGMIVALTYKTDLGDPTRFKKSDSVGAYYGMKPDNIHQEKISSNEESLDVVHEKSELYLPKQQLFC